MLLPVFVVFVLVCDFFGLRVGMLRALAMRAAIEITLGLGLGLGPGLAIALAEWE